MFRDHTYRLPAESWSLVNLEGPHQQCKSSSDTELHVDSQPSAELQPILQGNGAHVPASGS